MSLAVADKYCFGTKIIILIELQYFWTLRKFLLWNLQTFPKKVERNILLAGTYPHFFFDIFSFIFFFPPSQQVSVNNVVANQIFNWKILEKKATKLQIISCLDVFLMLLLLFWHVYWRNTFRRTKSVDGTMTQFHSRSKLYVPLCLLIDLTHK